MKRTLKSVLASILVLLLVVSSSPLSALALEAVWDGTAAASFESGTGTQVDPYIIKTAEQLAFLAQSVNSGNAYEDTYIRLDSDLVLNAADVFATDEAGNITGAAEGKTPLAWTPVGSDEAHAFSGNFDGNGHVVTGLFIDTDKDYAGLFGYVLQATIERVGVKQSFISSAAAYTGSIAGFNGGTIIRCFNSGSICGGTNTGGIAGTNADSICFCYNAGVVRADQFVGGVAGGNTGTISKCYNCGTITGNEDCGALVATEDGEVADCYYLSDCVQGGKEQGIALTDEQMRTEDSFESWNFESTWELEYESSYYYPTLRCFGSHKNTYHVRFFVGQNCVLEEYVTAGEKIIFTVPTGIEALEFHYWENGTERYYVDDTFTPTEDIDFRAVWSDNSAVDMWDGTFAASFARGTGSKADPYIIETTAELAFLAQSVNSGNDYEGKYISLENNIALNDISLFDINEDGENLGAAEGKTPRQWTPIGYSSSRAFKGNFNGNKHTISGLYISGENAINGLFGYTLSAVSNISLTNYYISSSLCLTDEMSIVSVYIGGIAGHNNGIISGCYCAGTIKSYDGSIGGIAGFSSGIIKNCENHGIVRGKSISDIGGIDIGGIAGECRGALNNCRNTGTVVATQEDGSWHYAGGIVGYYNANETQINLLECYNDGTVTGDKDHYGIVGGIVGYNSAQYGGKTTISHCCNLGTLSGYSVGGIVGRSNARYKSNKIASTSLIDNCFSGGVISGFTVGGIAGENIGYGNATISKCENEGTLTGQEDTGGIVGNNEAAVINCFNEGVIQGKGNVGGVVGMNEGSVSNCYNIKSVTGEDTVGGIAGVNKDVILRCYNNAAVSSNGQYSHVGGIAGKGYHEYNNYTYETSIIECYNAGEISGSGQNAYIGGIAGDGGVITDCYNIGQVSGSGRNSYTGGIIGKNDTFYADEVMGNVSNSYNAGVVSGVEYFGAIAGDSTKPVDNCYYLFDKPEGGNSFGITLSEEQMRAQETFENWNFNKTWELGYDKDYHYPTLKCFGSKDYYYRVRFLVEDDCIREKLVHFDENISLSAPEAPEGLVFHYWRSGVKHYDANTAFTPVDDIDLQAIWTIPNTSTGVWNGTADTAWAGNGTQESPYLITSAEELAGLAKRVNDGNDFRDKHFSLTTDIILNDGGDRFSEYVAGKNEWVPIGTGEEYFDGFSGILNGNGHIISGLYIHNDLNCAGLFGNIYDGSIENIGIEKSYIFNTQVQSNIGAFVGSAGYGSTISNCYNTGTVKGNGYHSHIGGIAGYGDTISNCYNTGTVIGSGEDANIGGIAGIVEILSTVSNCYNTGTVSGNGHDICIGAVVGVAREGSSISNCYYLSGCVQDENDYGTALSEARMRNKDSFENWDFNKTWENDYDKTTDYPTLRCFGSKEYYYRVRFFEEDTCLSQSLVLCGNPVVFEEAQSPEGTDFGYWRTGVSRYFANDEFTPEDDVDFYAVRTTRNTSADVWNGTADTDWAGKGTVASPYLITSAEELAGLANEVNRGERLRDKHFSLTTDIVLNDGGDKFSEYVAGKNDWMPIGLDDYFCGDFDGNGHTISGLYIYDALPYAGLFGEIGGGSITNLTVKDSYVYNAKKSSYTGGVAGSAVGSINGLISNCRNTGAVTGSGEYSHIGGIAGYGSTISNCYNTGTVTGSGEDSHIGGVAGDANTVSNSQNSGAVTGSGEYFHIGGVAGDGNTVSNSQNSGTVTGSGEFSYIGGIAGRVAWGNSSISNCYNTGTVKGSGKDSYIGGVAGDGDTISNCYNTGTVTGSGEYFYIGGIAGYGSTISNCYNTGTVTGSEEDSRIGGVAGDGSTISNCYNTGTVTGSGEDSDIGGIAGYGRTISNCYNTGTVTGSGEDSHIGGIAGYGNTIINCYNTGTVTGSGEVYIYTGGIAGRVAGDNSSISNCYNTGAITGSDGYESYTGGIVGETWNSNVSNCYYLAGCVTGGNEYGSALTEKQMRVKDNFVGFDFVNVWQIEPNGTYPYPFFGHRFAAKVTPPGAARLGYTTYTCVECGESYVGDYTAPTGKVSGFKCAARTQVAEKLTWNKVNGITGYQIQISNAAGNAWATAKATTANTYLFKGLTAGANYKFRVRFYIHAGGKNYFSPWSGTLTSPSLPASTALTKLSAGIGSFHAKWKKAAVTGYQLQYSTKANFIGAKTLTLKNANSLKRTVFPLKTKTYYYVRIRTYKTISGANYFSPWSKTYKVKTK